MTKLNVSLNTKSLNAAIEALEKYKKRAEQFPERFLKEFSERGAEIARNEVASLGAFDTGELQGSIQSEVRGDKGYVKATAPHAKFVEFGTGVVGAANTHPTPPAGWVYDYNNHGEAGWWYIGDDGAWHWTKGMPSRPFMYNTAKKLNDEKEEFAKELWNDLS